MANRTSIPRRPTAENAVIDLTAVDDVTDSAVKNVPGSASPKDKDVAQKKLNRGVTEAQQGKLSQDDSSGDNSTCDEEEPYIDSTSKHERSVEEDQEDVTVPQPQEDVTDMGVKQKNQQAQSVETEHSMTETKKLMKKIEEKTAQEDECISYDEKKFSGLRNLQPDSSEEKKGGCGVARKMKDKLTNEKLVIKRVPDVTKFNKNEIEAALKLSKEPCIACVLGFGCVRSCHSSHPCSCPLHPCLVLEDAGISLTELVNEDSLWQQLMKPKQLLQVMCDIFTGIMALSQHGYIHRDIKPQNICVDPHTLRAKVIDLGSCHKNGEKREECGLTLEYLDPCHARAYYNVCKEIQKQETFPPLEEKDDVYAVGLVLLFIMTRIHPMIFVGIGQKNYTIPNDPKKRAESLKNERVSVLQMMSHLVDEPSSVCREPQYRLKDKINQLLREFQCKLTPPLQEVVDRVLVVDKNCRASAEEMVNFLKKYLHPEIGQSFKAGSVSVPEEEFLDLGNKQNIGLTQQDQPEPRPVPARLLNVKTRQPPGFGQPSSDTDHPPAKMVRKDHQGAQE